ncbi:MAG: hypothetical protein COV74_07695 [Candidatus Omnitrophica bacterium CG11_big_fil_rev_8_21_14_0_20_45_26]|uniref:HPr domain-containing protein n=1 Tax=Candidatus Abzuiibacterium crystallinum TaxID=1974748 RepID=A0A2H0LMS7_9BACT|nr:MAG: hypothetical protein COV74_07695 [Candidatus Omnitrophica bacterium CG11_big_fil_rev_8_21_14_0_20_45_26]PIW65213.1 MAG: HPr family phosphocarrier protein [Candidatus Omnitrophica bacterium CG12_big_fil_rev_8_21_14_0_65_45_16]
MDKPHSKQTNEKFEQKFTIRNSLGLHARPAALFVQAVSRFASTITVIKGKQTVNGKSIMGIMMLAAGPGTSITVRAEGSDAAKAMAAIAQLFEENFKEK